VITHFIQTQASALAACLFRHPRAWPEDPRVSFRGWPGQAGRDDL